MELFYNASISDYKELCPIVIDFEKDLRIEQKKPAPSEKEIQRSKRYLKKYLQDKNCTYLVCKKQEKIIAYSFLSMDIKKKELGFVNELFVMPTERRKGVANRLMNHSLDWFKQNKCDTVQLTVNRANKFAITLYHKLGFAIFTGDYFDMQRKI